MVKLRHSWIRFCVGSLVLIQASGCASQSAKSAGADQDAGTEVTQESLHLMNIPTSEHASPARKLWTRKSAGLLTDLNISRDGSTILVATVPDRDSVEVGANRSRNYAALYSREGKVLSQIEMPAQIKSQALSSDGNLAIIATYDDQIRGYDRTGKLIWTHEGICKPFPFSEVHKILCFHDDDSEPELAFEVLDWQGNKVDSYPTKLDSLMVKVSVNEKYFVVGLNHGKVLVFDSTFKLLWSKSVDGELTDLAVSSATAGDPVVAALYNVRKQGKKHKSTPSVMAISSEQKLMVFSGKSKRSDSTPLAVKSRLDQIETSLDGKTVYGYGNDSDGQVIVRIDEESGKVAWTRSDPKPAEYSSQLLSVGGWLWIGFEDIGTTTRHSHVLGFDPAGALKSNIQVPSEEGSYLYAYAYADEAKLLAVGSDDGQLSLFGFK